MARPAAPAGSRRSSPSRRGSGRRGTRRHRCSGRHTGGPPSPGCCRMSTGPLSGSGSTCAGTWLRAGCMRTQHDRPDCGTGRRPGGGWPDRGGHGTAQVTRETTRADPDAAPVGGTTGRHIPTHPVAANLILGARRRGAGLASVLEALAESVAADVRARREIEADRAKPRATARYVTLITVGVLLVLGLTGQYIAPYGSPVGQVILVVLLSLYVATLVWMRTMATGKPLPRFIGAAARELSLIHI